MNGAEILKIRVPELLFSKPDKAIINAEYKALAKEWHPDVSKHPDPGKVFSHISWLADIALEKVAKGEWDVPGMKVFTAKDGTSWKINYRYRFAYEIGATYVSDTVIGFVVDAHHNKAVRSQLLHLKNILFPEARPTMRKNQYGEFTLGKRSIDKSIRLDVFQMIEGEGWQADIRGNGGRRRFDIGHPLGTDRIARGFGRIPDLNHKLTRRIGIVSVKLLSAGIR